MCVYVCVHVCMAFMPQVHLFDGLAMLTKLSVRGGKVTATQRFLQTQQWQ